MTPGFTAARALGAAHGRYKSQTPFVNEAGVTSTVTPQSSSVSGEVVGTFCRGHVLEVISVDRDETGAVTNFHVIDEVGSC